MAIDIATGAPVFANVGGGLSGPAIKPLALRLVYAVARESAVPVVGVGGISTWRDALEFIMAGAHAVQVGTAHFANPVAGPEIVEGIQAFLDAREIETWEEIRGCAHR